MPNRTYVIAKSIFVTGKKAVVYSEAESWGRVWRGISDVGFVDVWLEEVLVMMQKATNIPNSKVQHC